MIDPHLTIARLEGDYEKLDAAYRQKHLEALYLESQLAEAKQDTARLDWLQNSNITAQQAEKIVNGFIWDGAYRGGIRQAIDAARAAVVKS